MKRFNWNYLFFLIILILILDGLFRDRSSLWNAGVLLIAMLLVPRGVETYLTATRRRRQRDEEFYRTVVNPLNQWRDAKFYLDQDKIITRDEIRKRYPKDPPGDQPDIKS